MTTPLNDSKMRGSLSHEVRVAARQLAERRQAVSMRRAALGERLHAALTSPGMLLFAGGTGFLIAEFTGRADHVRDSNDPRALRRPTMAGARTALSFALQAYTLINAATAAIAGPREIQNGTYNR